MGKNYSKKTYEERKEEMNCILQQLEDGVRNVFESDNYIEYLKVYSKFYNYSINNIILILQQNPSATHVASFKDWNTKFHRIVKKNEKGIRILVPTPKKIIQDKTITIEDGSTETIQVERKQMYFKQGYVFDVSQTTGEELPSLVKQLTCESDTIDDIINKIISSSEIPINYDASLKENSPNGYYRPATEEIFIKPSLSSLHRLKTITHELSHYYQDRKYQDITKDYDRQTLEVIAESTAFCVLQMLANTFNMEQLDSSDYSFGYVAGWGSKDLKELKATLSLISDISNSIYSWFSTLF